MSNANKAIPEIEVMIFGEAHKLIFSIEAFCLLEEATGLDLMAGDVVSKLNTRNMSAFLWAALKAGGLNMDLTQFRQQLPMSELRAYHASIKAALENASPEQKKSDLEKTPTPMEVSQSDSEPTSSHCTQ
jgi:hypothetical protein